MSCQEDYGQCQGMAQLLSALWDLSRHVSIIARKPCVWWGETGGFSIWRNSRTNVLKLSLTCNSCSAPLSGYRAPFSSRVAGTKQVSLEHLSWRVSWLSCPTTRSSKIVIKRWEWRQRVTRTKRWPCHVCSHVSWTAMSSVPESYSMWESWLKRNSSRNGASDRLLMSSMVARSFLAAIIVFPNLSATSWRRNHGQVSMRNSMGNHMLHGSGFDFTLNIL